MSAPIRNMQREHLKVETPQESELRRRDVGQVEMQDEHGRRRTVDLADLNDADRALAEQFGYKPVCACILGQISCHADFSVSVGLQARVRLPLNLLFRRQYQWSFLHCCYDLLIPSLRRWICLCCLVLVDFWCWLHVYCMLCR